MFANDKLNVVQMMEFVLESVENIMRKGEHFSLQQAFYFYTHAFYEKLSLLKGEKL